MRSIARGTGIFAHAPKPKPYPKVREVRKSVTKRVRAASVSALTKSINSGSLDLCFIHLGYQESGIQL